MIDHSTPANPSRRQLAKLGAMAAAPLLLGAHAAGAAEAQATAPTARPMRNPLDEYPKPPFKKQSQEWPGLASKMDPRPDHGETSYKGSGKLTGRKALITGGDSGMGRAAAIAYAREGADVAINYLAAEEPDAEEVIKLIQSAGRKAAALPGDLREEAFCQKLITDTIARLGGLDILVINAAQQIYHEATDLLPSDKFDSIFKTNVYAMFWMMKAALPHMQPGSSIIITTSIQAYDPTPEIAEYAMTKAAEMNYIKSMGAALVKTKGIRVNGIAPGPIWTPLQVSGGSSMEKLEKFGSDTPYARPGQPAELASQYVLLASQDASYVSGEIYGITGGHPTA